MQTEDDVEIVEGMLVYRETPEGRIEGMVAKISELPPRQEMEVTHVHVLYEVHDASSKANELVDGSGWWPVNECYSTPT